MLHRQFVVFLLAAGLLAGCRTGRNYPGTDGPRYAGRPALGRVVERLNSGSVGRVARDIGYAWPTERGPNTTRGARWDHIFLRGLASPATAATGTVMDVRGASDHRPVWAIAILRDEATRRGSTSPRYPERN